MLKVTLPDGSIKEFDGPVSALQVAESIGSRLAKAAVGAKVNGELADLSTTLEADCELAIITAKTRDGEPDADAMYMLRHSTAHVMAEAIQRVVPGALLVYGPPLETGFYYDIAFPEDRPLREGDFEAIEKEMAKIVGEDRPFTRYELPLDAGFKKLKSEGSKYKLDNAERAADAGAKSLTFYVTSRHQIGIWDDGMRTFSVCGNPVISYDVTDCGEDLPTHLDLTDRLLVGRTGGYRLEPHQDSYHGLGPWEDLCRGPHIPSTGRIGAFKIMSLASSYWHGDENSDRLTRVYGTSFFSKKELDTHLHNLEEAKKRDHRVLGRQLDLFHIDEEVGQGLVLWTPRGSVIRKELQDWIGGELRKMGYTDVYCPHIGKLGLYKTSGHFPYYQDSQFTPVMEKEFLAGVAEDGCSCGDLSNMLKGGEIDGYLLKPMNCPHHIKIYASRPRSYRDLPVRLSEFGTVYRWEQSGELNGLTRVRCFTVDDAHLFCQEDQVADEVSGCLKLVKIALDTLGLEDFRVRVGLRDPDSSKYVGSPENWDKAEAACRAAAAQLGTKVTEEPGEAAFYGPKIDFVVRDVIGREWQLGTVQVDYNLPERFDLEDIGPDNRPHRPVMIHRAPFGSMERFVGVLIEHFAGAFPLWLSPEQVRVLPVSEKSNDYAQTLCEKLKTRGVRATVDTHNDRVQAKIKHAAGMKIPYSAIVGPRDEEAGQVSVRAFGIKDALGSLPIDEFIEGVAAEIACKGAERLVERFETATA